MNVKMNEVFLIIILTATLTKVEPLKEAYFSTQKDMTVGAGFIQNSLIKSLTTRRSTTCLVECLKSDACFTTVFNTISGECHILNNTVDSTDMFLTVSVNLYLIKLSGYNESCATTRCYIGLTCEPTLLTCRYKNLTQIKAYANVTKILTTQSPTQIISQFQYNSTYNSTIVVLQMSHTTTRPLFKYYIADNQNGFVLVYDQDFQFLFKKNVSNVYGIKVVYDNVYVSAYLGSKLYKMDLSLNIIKVVNGCQINPCLSYPLNVEYDEYTDLVYVAKSGFLYEFNRNLTLIRTITLPLYSDTMKIRNGLIYAKNNSDIVVFNNNTVINTFQNISQYSVHFYLFNDYIFVTAGGHAPASYRSIRAFDLNGTQMSNYVNLTTFPASVYYLGIDPKGRAYGTLNAGLSGFVVF